MSKYKYDWSLHNRIRKQKPKPKFCEICKKRTPYDLANKSQKYKDDVDDWFWLCRRCHLKYDGILEKLHKLKFKKNCLNCGKEFLSQTKTNIGKYSEKYCKNCNSIMRKTNLREYGKKYRKDNWNIISAKKKKWIKDYLKIKENKEKYNKTRRIWYGKNREKQIKSTLKSREKHKENYFDYMKKWRRKNKERLKKYTKYYNKYKRKKND